MTTRIVELRFQLPIASDSDEEAIADAKAAVIDAFPTVEDPSNVSATIEGQI